MRSPPVAALARRSDGPRPPRPPVKFSGPPRAAIASIPGIASTRNNPRAPLAHSRRVVQTPTAYAARRQIPMSPSHPQTLSTIRQRDAVLPEPASAPKRRANESSACGESSNGEASYMPPFGKGGGFLRAIQISHKGHSAVISSKQTQPHETWGSNFGDCPLLIFSKFSRSGPISFWTTRAYFPIFSDSKRRHGRPKRVAGATGRATTVVPGGPCKETASKTARIDACDAAQSPSRTFGGPKGD